MRATPPPETSAPPRGAARRAASRALVRKEMLQILRDPSSILIGGILPLLLLFLFGFGVSLDLRNVAVCVVVEATTPDGLELRRLVRAPRASSPCARFATGADCQSRPRGRPHQGDRRAAGRVLGARRRAAGRAPIQVLVDGSDPNTAGLVAELCAGPVAHLARRGADSSARGRAPPGHAGARASGTTRRTRAPNSCFRASSPST